MCQGSEGSYLATYKDLEGKNLIPDFWDFNLYWKIGHLVATIKVGKALEKLHYLKLYSRQNDRNCCGVHMIYL